MRKTTIILALILTLISCKQKSNNYGRLIIGDWKSFYEIPKETTNEDIIILPRRFSPFGESGYSFYKNGEVENKTGYFDFTEKDNDGRNKRKFLGSYTKYRIKNDRLEMFDLKDKKWVNIKIFKLTKDSLILEYNDKSKEKFLKQHYKIDPLNSFDKVIVSTSGCYGTCPIDDIMISKSGEIEYYGKMYVDQKGYCKSKISRKSFIKIENNYKKANFINLKDDYIASRSDAMTITTTFIKDGKILKTITDYGDESPTEMKWATLPIVFLNQNIKLERKDEPRKFVDFEYARFISGKKVCELTKSECFYLKSILQNCEESKKDFKVKYTINYWTDDTEKKVESDGQYFKFETKKGEFTTLNLGYNFLEKNNLLKRVRNKTEYD
ncbi:DUF6438 domain-containing protein [Flavobacterium aquiphilum]|uniref:DUF6438 domain-containing protein n=1 Tax=Flavobacterium aquiphilum TaxID=3003261 RepID=UPI0024818386|nr:DUF6438 domain-containing protein [Flavobacterium aquiphilum]